MSKFAKQSHEILATFLLNRQILKLVVCNPEKGVLEKLFVERVLPYSVNSLYLYYAVF